MNKTKSSVSKTEASEPFNMKGAAQLHIIAIGASAGGLEALQDFLAHLPAVENICIIVAQHLSPTHKSMLVPLLSKETALLVVEAAHNSALEANKIYITPPDKEIAIVAGRVLLTKPHINIGPKPSVDVLFHSLAAEGGTNIIGVILSGTGSDGASGIRAIKKVGGLTLAQEPHTAKYDGMPLSAIETGEIDLVLPPERMGEEIREYVLNPATVRVMVEGHKNESTTLEKIIDLLTRRTGTDFTNYKPATIIRRLEKRLAILKIKSIDEYLKILERSPREQDEMFNMILIGVTTFFRDMEAFGALENCLHKIINAKTNAEPLRIWVPGCSTGEEAYSIAILFNRILRTRTQQHSIQIFATDIDERAIAVARKGIYTKYSLQGVPLEIVDNYFLEKENGFELIKPVRSMVLFSKHDITNNPPFLNLDLISCRNLLIYFGANLQHQIIPIFHYALLQDGYLLLGKSETVGQFGDLFSTLDGKNKIFQRKRGGSLHSIKFSAFKAQKQLLQKNSPVRPVKKDLSVSDLVKETIFNTFEDPYVVINEACDIQEINGDVRLFLSLPQGSIQVNLLKMVNAELQIEVRSVVTKTIKNREAVKSGIKKFELFGKQYHVRVKAKPLIYTETAEELFLVIFERLELDEFIAKGAVAEGKELVSLREQDLERELAVTKEHLQTYIEELETSNEEMQSLNEEMQSTNEELQSSNEELETSNEELQSTNEEIQIAYAELKAANEELERKELLLKENEANIQALLNNKLQGLILIDKVYKIIALNEKAREVFTRLLGDTPKTNDTFISFVEPVQLELFVNDFSKAIQGLPVSREISLRDRGGIEYWFSINYTPVIGVDGKINAITLGLLEITQLKTVLSDLNTAERLLSSVFNATQIGICVTDDRGFFVDVNNAYCKIYGYEREELIGQSFTIVIQPAMRISAQQLHDDFIEAGSEIPGEWLAVRKDGTEMTVFATAELMQRPDGKKMKVTSVRDVSAQKKADEAIEASRLKYKAIIDSSVSAIFLTTPDGTILEANEAACSLFGYTEIELCRIGRQGIIDHTQDEFYKRLEEREQTGRTKGEVTGRKSNGERLPLEYASSVFTDKQGQQFAYTIINDISGRKKIEREKLLLINNTEESFILLDESLKIISFNTRFERLYKLYLGKQVVKGNSILDYAQPERREIVSQIYQRVLAGSEEESEISFPLPDGMIKHFSLRYKPARDEHGLPIGAFVTIADTTEKHLALQQLANSERRFRALVENGADAIVVLDRKGEPTYVSPNFQHILGYTVEEAIDLGAFSIIHPDDISVTKEKLGECLQNPGQPVKNIVYRILHKNGHWVWLESTLTNLTDNPVISGVVNNLRDITVQKTMEVRLTAITDNLNGVVYRYKLHADGTDELQYVSRGAIQLWGIPAEEAMANNKLVWALFENDDRQQVMASLQKSAASLSNWAIEWRIHHPDGTLRWQKSVGLPTRLPDGATVWDAVIVDITAAKNNEQEILRAKENQEALINGTEDLIWAIDKNLRLITANQAYKAFIKSFTGKFTAAGDLVIGKGFDKKLHQKWLAYYERALRGDVFSIKENIYNPAVKRREYGLITFSPMLNAGGSLLGVACYAKNITDDTLHVMQLQTTKAELDKIMDSSLDMICTADAQGHFIKVSAASINILGYSPAELRGRNQDDFVFEEDLQKTAAARAAVMSGKQITNFENRYKRKDGSLVTLSWSASWDETEKTRYGVARDTTEKKAAEEALNNSERRFRSLVQDGSDLIAIVDGDANYTYVSPTTLSILGYPSEELIGQNAFAFIHPQDIDHASKSFATVLTVKKVNASFRFRHKNGSWRWLETVATNMQDEPAIAGIIVNSRDVTENKLVEDELKESSILLAEAQRLAKMGSWNFDFKADKLTWSDQLYNVFGTDKETFGGTHNSFLHFVDERDRELVLETSRHTQLTGKPFNIQYRIKTSAGEMRIIEEYGYGEKDTKGSIIRLFGTAQDITERKKAEDQLKASNERYHYLTKATSDAIWDWNMHDDTLYWGDAYHEGFGYDLAQIKPDISSWLDNIHPDDANEITASKYTFIQGAGANWEAQYRYRKADGSYAYVIDRGFVIRDKEGKAVKMIGGLRDITERKKEEIQLKLLESVILSTSDAVLITDANPIEMPGPKILFANDAFLKMTGYLKEELIGKTPRILQGPKTDATEVKKIGEALRKPSPVESTIINYKKSGDEFWVNLSITPIFNAKGECTHFIAIQRNVTKEKIIELQKSLLSDISQLFNSNEDLYEILVTILEKICLFGNFTVGAVWIASKNSGKMQRVADYTTISELKSCITLEEDSKQVDFGEGLAGIVWETGKIQWWKNINENNNFERQKNAAPQGAHAACGIPLLYNEETIGVLTFWMPRNFVGRDGMNILFEDLGGHVAIELKRKQLELELKQIFNFSPDAICTVGYDGYFKKFNHSLCRLFEYSETEILARQYLDLVHPDDRSKTIMDARKLIDGEKVFYYENRYLTKSGKIKWLAWTTSPSPEEDLIFAVAKDITEKKEIERILNKAIGLARIGTWEIDVSTKALYWSEMTRFIYDVGPEYIPETETALDFYKEITVREIVRRKLSQSAELGLPWEIEAVICTAKGMERWVKAIGEAEFVNGRCVRLYGSIQDVTDTKNVEIAIKNILAEKNNILESIDDAFFTVNNDWVVTYWNRVAEKLLQTPKATILGKDLWAIFTESIQSVSFKKYHEAVTYHQSVHFEDYFQPLDKWFDISAYPSANGLSVYFKDISEKKKAAMQLKLLNENLERQTKELSASNAELEQFAYVASHDLQEPLRMITSFLTLLDQNYTDVLDEKGKKFIYFAVDGAKRMRQIILDLLEYSRAGRLDMYAEKVDLNTIVDEIKALYYKEINEKSAVITVSDLPEIFAATSPMRQIFQNLIGNALKYSRTDIPPLIDIKAVENAAEWLITVADNGIGISPEYFDKVFLIFQRLHSKEKYSGTGLGLAITKKIVENYSGRIWLESEENVGSIFYFTISKQVPNKNAHDIR